MTRSQPGADGPSARDPVEELAEAFLERYRRGERPSLTEFTERAPEHADEIRELFPALVLIEQAIPAVEAGVGHATREVPHERLGDYRIIREIGRGGMGIVYEAEQEALGRHVALKVLPAGAGGPHCLLRFVREARSAARLHHTNIVPVHDIGEREGVHYYAMQFIRGQSLDAVITELRRLRGHDCPRELAGLHANAVAPPSSGAASLAGSLLSGQFRKEARIADPAFAIGDQRLGNADSAAPSPSPTDAESGSLSSVLTDNSDFSTRSDCHFYRSVAQVGLQIADALAYAHGQRVLHRDIKPSNLLLDAHGTIWVTDFGLAKEEGGDLTRTGEIVGTLRYMAPERFSGKSDGRSDIFSLGLTLYELLTLRPAFQESDRARLIRAISHQEPAAPRKFDPHVPRDLETIVLKAITKEPAGRYAIAEDLREDLRRFLADRPIRARRASTWELARRWCRRNPGWAATIGTVLGLLIVISLGGTLLSWHLRQALTALQSADRAKTEKLWEAYVERARALRSSGRVGQRFEALKAIREAAKIKVTPELRDEAVAALVLPDVEIHSEWDGFPEGTQSYSYDAAFQRYARIDSQGRVTVCQRSADTEEVIAHLPSQGKHPICSIHLSPDGRFLVYDYGSQPEVFRRGLRIWKIDGTRPSLHLEERSGVYEFAVSFHADGRRLAIGHTDGTISIHDLTTKSPPKRLKVGQMPNSLAFNPRDGRLAAACRDCVRLFDVDTEKELPPLRLPKVDSWSHGLAWHPDGRLLATTSEDQKIHLWDTHTATEVIAPLTGHTSSGIYMSFNHRGDRLISCGWDGQPRLWDAATGQLLLTMPGRYGVQFSGDDSLIGVEQIGTKLRLWRLADGRELRTIRRPGADSEEIIHGPVLEADGRVLAAASSNGLGFIDLESGAHLAFIHFKNDNVALPISFDRIDGWMTSGKTGVMLWPLQRNPTRTDRIEIGPPRWLGAAVEHGADASLDGRIRVLPQGNQALVLDRDRPGWRVELGPQYDVRHCAVSPDGRWAATCSWWTTGNSKSVRIWEALTGRHIVDLPLQAASTAGFSPDGRWLATQTGGHGGQLWEVDTWRPGIRFDGNFCWNTDGRLLAVQGKLSVIGLLDPESGKEVCVLTGPEAKWYATACLTKDGTKLIATVSDRRALYVWDLRLIRKELQELGMDWDLPEFAPPANSESSSPPALHVDSGFFRQPFFKDDRLTLAVCTLQLALQPLNPEAYLERGLAAGRLTEAAKAVADYEMFLALTDRNDRRRPEIQLRRAFNYHLNLKDNNKAIGALAEVLDSSTELIPWPARFALLCNDLAWESTKEPPHTSLADVISRLAQKAVELEPHNSLYQNTLGVVLYRQGKYEDAVRWLERSLEHSRQFAAFDCYFLAMSYERLGQPTKARDYFDRADASVENETTLSTLHRQELAVFRAEAETVLGISRGK
jgi:eukaryotic-like serine/threonine-protein kinase